MADNSKNYSITAFVRSYYNEVDNSTIAKRVYSELNQLYEGLKDADNQEQAENHLEKMIPFLSPDALEFLSGLDENVNKGEEITVDEIVVAIEEFNKIHGSDEQPIDVILTSAVALSSDQKDRIIEKFRSKVGGHHLFIHEVVDQNVMGGVRLETENYYYDNTIVNKLREMKEFILNDQ